MTDGINVKNEILALNWRGTSDDAVKWVQLPHENILPHPVYTIICSTVSYNSIAVFKENVSEKD